MPFHTTVVLSAGLLSASLTALICANASRIGKATGLVDLPDSERRFHSDPTPLIGGIAVLLPVLLIATTYMAVFAHQEFMPTCIAAAAAMMLVGVVDDRANVSSGWRFVALTYIVFCAFSFEPLFVIHTLRFQYSHLNINIPLDPIAAPITAFMVLGLVNASNMADGMNGQLLGSALVWSGFIVHRMGLEAGLPYFLLICSLIVALTFNLRSKLFSGSAGAYALTMFVALGAIANYRGAHGAMHADTPVFWFWLPIADCLRLMVVRVTRGKAPSSGDRNHFHHMLLDMMRRRYAIGLYVVMLAIAGGLAEIDEAWGKFGLAACVVIYALLVARAEMRSRAAKPKAVAAAEPVFVR